MTIAEVFYYTATIVFIVTAVVLTFVGWRIYITLAALQKVLETTRQTLLDIREAPQKIQTNFMNSALNVARFIWGRG